MSFPSSPGEKRRLNNRYDYDGSKRNKTNYSTSIGNEDRRRETDPKNILYVRNLDAVDSDLFTSFLYHLMKELCLLDIGQGQRSIKNFVSGISIGKRGTGLLFFVEFRDATAALQLNNIPFMGKKVHLERPNSWSGPKWLKEARCSWDDRLEKFYSEGRSTRASEDSSCRENLPMRELAIKNIPFKWVDALPTYIASSMEQIGLVKDFEDPVENFRPHHKSENMGILTFRTEEYAHNAFLLQNLPFFDKCICFERGENFPSRCYYQDSEKNWSKSMNEFFHSTFNEKYEWEVDSIRKECSPLGKQDHNADGIKRQLEVAERKLKENLLQNRTLSAALSKKSRLLETCEDTVRSKDSEIVRLHEEQINFKATIKQVRNKLEEILLQNKNLSATLSIKTRVLEACEDTVRSKGSEVSRLQEEQRGLMATVKQVGIERDSLKTELGGSRLRLTEALSSVTEAQSTTKTVQDSGEVIFLRKELKTKRTELQEKARRIKELEVASEKHMERIMNMTDGLLSGGMKQRNLQEKLQNERIRRISLGTSQRNLEEKLENERVKRISLETDLAKKEENNGIGIAKSGDCVILVKEEEMFYGS